MESSSVSGLMRGTRLRGGTRAGGWDSMITRQGRSASTVSSVLPKTE